MICAGKKGKDSCQVNILNTEVDSSRWGFKKLLGLIRLSPLVYDICIKRDAKNKTKKHISLLGNNQIRGGVKPRPSKFPLEHWCISIQKDNEILSIYISFNQFQLVCFRCNWLKEVQMVEIFVQHPSLNTQSCNRRPLCSTMS